MTAKTALLLIDVQEDFLARPGLTPDRATLVATLSAMLEHARASGWCVIHVHTRVDPTLADAMPHRRNSGEAEVIAGTPGAQPPVELEPHEGEPLMFKRFFSAFDSSQLEPLLRSCGAERLIIAGVHSHACIRDTVSDAYARGFDVVIPEGAIGSYDAAHAYQAVRWMAARSMRTAPLRDFVGDGEPVVQWTHRDPCDQSSELGRVVLTPAAEVDRAAERLAIEQRGLAELGLDERRRRLTLWRDRLRSSSTKLTESLVQNIAKPLRDAESELSYGFALLDAVIDALSDCESEELRTVHYRPRGAVGLITPWNNPFAIPVGKIAPALGFGNAVMWKPALAATAISVLMEAALVEAGLGEWLALVPGDSATGDAIIGNGSIVAVSFTGSVPVGEQLVARAGTRASPPIVQAELGGSNCAVVDSSADIDAAAADLAAAMFSYSGQRCTAIRRVVVVDDVAHRLRERLVAETEALCIGLPQDSRCQIGPVLDADRRSRLLDAIRQAERDGGRIICGGDIPSQMPRQGCWLEPTLVEGMDADHPLNRKEWFGPVATVTSVKSLDDALAFHNHSSFGLLGAIYANDERHVERFVESAKAGILSVGRARPPFSARGPFHGWKSSGYGTPEHGRWNRDFYCRPQAVYRQG